MKNQNKYIESLLKIEEDLYRLKIENMYVDMSYSKNNKSLNECVLNILKRKTKRS